MGNRAVITTTNALRENGSLKKNEIGIYLHWCGSPENVQRFLTIMTMESTSLKIGLS